MMEHAAVCVAIIWFFREEVLDHQMAVGVNFTFQIASQSHDPQTHKLVWLDNLIFLSLDFHLQLSMLLDCCYWIDMLIKHRR